jgi:hypothetical protein
MTRDQESFYAMVLKVKNFGIKNLAAMAAIPSLALLFAQLTALINALINADKGSRADLTGYAMEKAVKRNALEAICEKLSDALAAYGAMNSNFVLQKRADFNASQWYSFSEENLMSEAMIVKDLATPVGAALAPFGAGVADITALDTALTAFTAIVNEPTLNIDMRKEDNKKIVQISGEIKDLFNDKLDVVMKVLKSSNPTLHNLYLSARAIDDNGSATAPTVLKVVAPKTIATIHKAVAYNEDTFYTVQNRGNDAVTFSLSTTETAEGPEPVTLNGGETRTRLASNLAVNGTFLVVKNPSLSNVEIKLWVE